MTWQANGNYYSFKQETIRAYAPSASGVYGLYNRRHQILIGNSANIKDALLRHLSESPFRFSWFVPTGFVFELFPAESRDLRAQELIREYDPILQTNASVGFSVLWRAWLTPAKSAFEPQLRAEKITPIDNSKPASHSDQKWFRDFHLDRTRFAIIAATFGAMLLAVGLTMVASHRRHPSEILSEISAPVRKLISKVRTTADIAWLRTPGALGLPKPLNEETKVLETNIKVQTPQTPDTAIGQAKIEGPAISDAASSSDLMTGENETALLTPEPKTGRKAKIVKKEERPGGWTVQAMATTDKRIASHWLERLKAKGYEAFVVKAEIRRQTWYRVRAGHFNTPKEAESLRAGLKSTEGFQDAFVAANMGSEILVASYLNGDFPVNR